MPRHAAAGLGRRRLSGLWLVDTAEPFFTYAGFSWSQPSSSLASRQRAVQFGLGGRAQTNQHPLPVLLQPLLAATAIPPCHAV